MADYEPVKMRLYRRSSHTVTMAAKLGTPTVNSPPLFPSPSFSLSTIFCGLLLLIDNRVTMMIMILNMQSHLDQRYWHVYSCTLIPSRAPAFKPARALTESTVGNLAQ